MSGHLCLKWNNHSSAFLKNITRIQIKERFSDATIICGGKYFAVHRIVLSTCSDYFDEVFERIQCQHPYIVFKDIESKDMELLLNYMYHGEVTVTQGCLPALIKAAEVLRVKGLAVPDDDITSGEIMPEKKKKIEEHKRRKADSSEDAIQITDHTQVMIKEEPQDASHDEENDLKDSMVSLSNESQVKNEGIDDYPMNSLDPANLHLKKSDETVIAGPLIEEQSSSWASFATSDPIGTLPPNPFSSEEDITRQHMEIVFAPSSQLPLSIKPGGTSAHPENANLRRLTTYQCTHCQYRSTRKDSVKRHLLVKHIKHRPFLCPYCPKRFGSGTDLRRHTLIHTGEKPYQCTPCRRRFRYRRDLNLHRQMNAQCHPSN